MDCYWVPTQAQVVERVKLEILCAVAGGMIPPTVKSFSELHDYTDANCLGGFCEDGFTDALIEHFGGRDQDTEAMPDGMMALLNGTQDAVNAWIARGGVLDAMAESLGVTVANTLDRASHFTDSTTREARAALNTVLFLSRDLERLGISLTEPAASEIHSASHGMATDMTRLHLALISFDEARAKFHGGDQIFRGSRLDLAMKKLTDAMSTEHGLEHRQLRAQQLQTTSSLNRPRP